MDLISQEHKNGTLWGKYFAIPLCIAIMEVFYQFMRLSSYLSEKILPYQNELEQVTLKELFYAISAIAIAFICGRTPKDLFKVKNGRTYKFRRKIITVFIVVQIFASITIHSMILEQQNEVLRLRPSKEIVLFLAFVLFIGIAEEIIFRGIIAESMKNVFHDANKGAIISGILFGLMHLVNFGISDPDGVIVQAISAAAAGMMIADIYYYSGTLWIGIIYHSAVDFCGFLGFGLYGLDSPYSIISSYSPVMAVPGLLYIFLRIKFTAKRAKIKKARKITYKKYQNTIIYKKSA